MAFIPSPRMYCFASDTRKKFIKRRARFAPQLLADGLTSGIVSDQANLVHGSFDESEDVDPYCNIHSDKFALMQLGLDSVSVSPSDTSSSDSSES